MTLNILLIEDSLGDTLLLEEMITECRQPCRLTTAKSLSTALDLIKKEQFDAVILDLFLPDSSGIETFQKIQTQKPDLPFIILTGFADEQLAREAISLGAQDYLFKGKFDSALMHRSVMYAIERKQAANQLGRAKELSEALNLINSLIFSTLDFDEIMKRVVEGAAKAAGADSAAIYFPDGDQWVARYVYGLEGLAGRHIAPDEIKYSLQAVTEKRPVLISNVPGNEEMCRIPIIREYEVKALLDAPLFTGDDTVGNFALYSCVKTDAFKEEHVEFVNKVAASVALAVKNARLVQALRESEERFRTLYAYAPVGIELLDLEGRFIQVNSKLVEMLGYSEEELLQRNFTEVTHPEDLKKELPLLRALFDGQAYHYYIEKRYIHKDGHHVWVRATSTIAKTLKPYRFSITEDITKHKVVEEERSHLAAIVESSDAAIISLTKDLNGIVRSWNKGAEGVYGYTAQEAIGRNVSFLVPPGHPKDVVNILEKVGRGEVIKRYETTRMRKGGAIIFVSLDVSPIRDAEGRIIGASTIANDITERVRAEEALRESEERNSALIKASAQALYRMSPDWSEMRQLQGGSFIADTDKPNRNWLEEYIHPEDQKWVLEIIGESVKTGKIFELEHRVRRLDGTLGWMFSRAVPVRNEVGKIKEWFGAASDITERKKMEEELMHMAEHDVLTGLPNRRLFIDLLKLEMAQARRHRKKIGILFLDLDRFKDINDTLGHMSGDELLKKVSARLKDAVRESDTVARIGGDEFNIILADIDNAEDIREIARKILDRFRLPFAVAGRDLNVSTSIGISSYPDDGKEIDTLLRYADIAMYHAKDKGRNNYQFYNPTFNSRSLELMKFENELVRAIERGEFRLYYQPLVRILSGKITSTEALLRWQHPERGLLLPEHFLGIAQRIGFMPEIDDWVLKATVGQINRWRASGIAPSCINVNMSPAQFERDDLVEEIKNVLNKSEMPPECLYIEITETMAMRNVEVTVARLHDLKDLGVVISIDDFGTGYSSLSQLKRLPIRKLKIDRSFINDITSSSDDRNIITAIIHMAHSMKIEVVAEGVENKSQLSFLQELKCDEAQGNFFSKPLPAEEFEELVMRS